MTTHHGTHDMLDYWLYRAGKEVEFASLPQNLQDTLLDLGNAVQRMMHDFQCVDHPGGVNMVTVRLNDDGTSVKLWACCPFRWLVLELMLKLNQVPGDVCGPHPPTDENLEQLSARVKAYFDDLFPRHEQ